jgi:serine/threonine-protein kinase haspin
MPRQQVYGRRGALNSAFKLSAVFCSDSSPLKFEKTIKEDVETATDKLGSLKITESMREAKTERPKVRRALVSKDGNVAVPKATVGRKKKKRTKSTEIVCDIKEDIPEPIEILEEEAATLGASEPPRTESPRIEYDPPQGTDPYIHPLLPLSTNPAAPQQFTAWSQTIEPFFTISKIAEASYGEVYRLSLSHPHPTFTSTDESVLKILALKPPPPLQDSEEKKSKGQIQRERNMSSVSSVCSETQLLKRMTEVPGFTNFRALHILQGRPSPAFVTAWKAWNKSKPAGQKSTFPDPSRKANYSEEQMWAVIEMQDAGTDAEKLQEEKEDTIGTVEGIWDVFWQVVIAVGKGEEIAGFEHRDLHLGNICVNQGRKRKRGKVGGTGLESTIIDYTLSRAEMSRRRPISSSSSQTATSTLSISSHGQAEEDEVEIAFLDLSLDPGLFESNAAEEYQYEVYRYMRNAMYFSDALKPYPLHEAEATATGRSWRGFHPQTNLVWLHLVLGKLMGGVTAPPSEAGEGNSEGGRWRWSTLKEVEQLLRIENIPREGLGSVRDLIGIALAESWLDEEDVVGEALPDFAQVLEDVGVKEAMNEKKKQRGRKVC